MLIAMSSCAATDQQRSSGPPLLNRFMSWLLRSPLHGMASRSVMLITFTGRKSGKTYTTPVSYARNGDRVTAFTGARWWRNLEGGAPVTLLIQRQELHGWAVPVAEDKQAVAAGLQAFLRQVRGDARFYGVRFDPDGEPNWDDVRRAAGRVVMLGILLDGARDRGQPDTGTDP